MEELFPVAGIIAAGAITPGPNNLIVLERAGRAGFGGAFPAILGVLLGGVALLAFVMSGGLALFAVAPWLRGVIILAGVGYLVLLGARLFVESFRSSDAATDVTGMPTSLAGVAVFQWLNPKAWVMAATVGSAVTVSTSSEAVQLAALYIVIPLLALSAWSGFGVLLLRVLQRPGARHWFDRTMGLLLAVSAVLLVF